jgi:hypothetical protein
MKWVLGMALSDFPFLLPQTDPSAGATVVTPSLKPENDPAFIKALEREKQKLAEQWNREKLEHSKLMDARLKIACQKKNPRSRKQTAAARNKKAPPSKKTAKKVCRHKGDGCLMGRMHIIDNIVLHDRRSTKAAYVDDDDDEEEEEEIDDSGDEDEDDGEDEDSEEESIDSALDYSGLEDELSLGLDNRTVSLARVSACWSCPMTFCAINTSFH